jgi:hypothetical protein
MIFLGKYSFDSTRIRSSFIGMHALGVVEGRLGSGELLLRGRRKDFNMVISLWLEEGDMSPQPNTPRKTWQFTDSQVKAMHRGAENAWV